MLVRVRLHNSSWEGMIGGPVRWTPGNHELELPDGSTVKSVLEALAVPEHLVALVALNRRAAEVDAPLSEGDLVEVIPPVTGGLPHPACRHPSPVRGRGAYRIGPAHSSLS